MLNQNENNDNRWIEMVEGEQGKIRDGDIYPKLKNWIDEVSPKNILDIGCGQGICSTKINLENREYTGIDLSSYLISRAQVLYPAPNRKFIAGNASQLPFPDQTFDACYSIALWHLIKDLPKALKEMARVLKGDGHFFAITANSDFNDFWKALETDSEKLFIPTNTEIESMLKSVGLYVEKAETFRSFLLIRGRKI